MYNVKPVLELYLPSLLDLLGNQQISWSSINELVQRHLDTIRSEISRTKTGVWRDATFYSVLINHHFGDKSASGMFSFYNETFKSLKNNIPADDRLVLHRMVTKVLSNLNKGYVNFIGELACLNKLMLSGNYILINIEEKINSSQGTSADIFLKQKNDSTEILIDVVNLHLEDRHFATLDDMDRHIRSKILKKVSDKNINPNRPVYIQPVLWTESLEQLTQAYDLYKSNDMEISSSFIPYTYATWRHSDGSFEHRFETVSSILDER